jgi:hypothetical protein
MIDDLIAAVEDRAMAMGWIITNVTVQDCTRGDPPGQQVIFDIHVPADAGAEVGRGERTFSPIPRGTMEPPGAEIPPPAAEEEEGIGTGWIIGGVLLALGVVGTGIYFAVRD